MRKRARTTTAADSAAASGDDASHPLSPAPVLTHLPPSLLPLSLIHTSPPPPPDTWTTFLARPHLKHQPLHLPPTPLHNHHAAFDDLWRHCR